MATDWANVAQELQADGLSHQIIRRNFNLIKTALQQVRGEFNTGIEGAIDDGNISLGGSAEIIALQAAVDDAEYLAMINDGS